MGQTSRGFVISYVFSSLIIFSLNVTDHSATSVFIRFSILLSSFANAKKVKKRMPMALTDVIADVTKAPVPTHKKYLVLEAMLQDEDFEEVELPYVRLKLF